MSARTLCIRCAFVRLQIWVCVSGRFRTRLPATPHCFPSLVVPALPPSCLLLRVVSVCGRFRPQLPATFPCSPPVVAGPPPVACGLWSVVVPLAAFCRSASSGPRPTGQVVCAGNIALETDCFACRSVDSVGTDQTKSRAICTALRAAPLRIWSATHQKVSPLGEVRSRRIRPT